jgi:hypothetical protein
MRVLCGLMVYDSVHSDSLGECAIDLLHDFGSGESVTDWYDLVPIKPNKDNSKQSALGRVQLGRTEVTGGATRTHACPGVNFECVYHPHWSDNNLLH